MVFNNMLSLNDAPNYSTKFTSGGCKVAPHNTVPQSTTVPRGTAWCIILRDIEIMCTFKYYFTLTQNMFLCFVSFFVAATGKRVTLRNQQSYQILPRMATTPPQCLPNSQTLTWTKVCSIHCCQTQSPPNPAPPAARAESRRAARRRRARAAQHRQ